ncbi:hypothetical protein [Bartonella krasnovii]|uniref:hypothetical protein n=1 Tax=Bartonella krasnovii TaxID=2267275 RepID=UPI001F4C5DC9|nr:hypothetical protein [Bartonella krasnovii]UNF39123.1 hypothetical protein MNL10_01325 [Bartonella krasnovii]UNF44141.1 hypothetical protein MNL07_01150 [Bartonella krasnovii]UNF47320.1 hypothetical protein MNL05_01140 [Bartonella krasnovii]UNF50664.1 hypothetical protein MNL03_01325 [Bartonella krasnovii]
MHTINFLSYKYEVDTDSKLVNTNCIDNFLQEGTYNLPIKNQYSTLTIEKFSVGSSTYYWVYILTGEESPYNPEVIDSENGFQSIPNPRSKKQIEQNKQYFGVLIPTKFILLSSSKKLNQCLQSHYKENFKEEINILPELINKQDFEKKLRSIKEIKLEYKKQKQLELFGTQSEKYLTELAKNALDGFSTNDVTEIELTLDIKLKEENNLRECFWNFLKKGKKNPILHKLSFVGNTYDKFDVIFNTESFQHTILIKASKDDNGRYNEDSVKKELMLEIEDFTVSL